MPDIDPTTDDTRDPQRFLPGGDQYFDDLEIADRPARQREGLPPAYRMRADSHYVDLLADRSSPTREAAPSDAPAQQSAGSTGIAPAALALSADAGLDLARSLATLGSCAELLTGAASDLSRTVAGSLIAAEVWRATTLLEATRVIRREVPFTRTSVPIRTIIDRVAKGFGPEQRLRSLVIDTRVDLSHESTIVGDEHLLATALSGAVTATLAVLEGVSGARLTLGATAEPQGHLTLSVSQNSVAVPDTWFARAFDYTWATRPGGSPTLVAMMAVKMIAEVHGGRAAAGPAGRGTAIAITLPVGRTSATVA